MRLARPNSGKAQKHQLPRCRKRNAASPQPAANTSTLTDIRLNRARVLAAIVMGAEQAAVRYWMENRSGSLVATVRDALEQALAGIGEQFEPP